MPRKFNYFFIPFFSVFAFILYSHWGASDKLAERQAIVQIDNVLSKMTQVEDLTKDKLLHNLQEIESKIVNSHHALGRLGSIYQELGFYDHAIIVFNKAAKLSPSNYSYLEQIFYNHALQNNGRLPPEIRVEAKKAVRQDISQKAIINLLAVDDYLRGNYKEAVLGWRLLLKTDKELTNDRKQSLINAINKAQAKAIDLKMNVKVSLSKSLNALVAPQDTVYIFVKSANTDNPMPLAVIKKHAHELPLNVNLGNEQSMMGSDWLEEGREIRIIAKISKSGDPLDKKGDLRGTSQILMVKSGIQPIEIIINEKT